MLWLGIMRKLVEQRWSYDMLQKSQLFRFSTAQKKEEIYRIKLNVSQKRIYKQVSRLNFMTNTIE